MGRNHKILFRQGTTVPSGSNFDIGEPAWDRVGKKLYMKAEDGTMVEIAGGGGAPAGGGGNSFTSSETAPASPSSGDLWLDQSSGILYLYDSDANSSQWVEYSAPTQSRTFISSPTPPVGPIEGQEWFNSETGVTYRYLYSTWVEAIGVATTEVPLVVGGATSTSLTVTDTLVIKRNDSVLQVALNNLVSFLSNSTASGFNYPGADFSAGPNPPTNPSFAAEWHNTDTGVTYRYLYSAWVETIGVSTAEVPIVIGDAVSTSLNVSDTVVIKRNGSVLQVALNDLVGFLENSASSGFNIPGRSFTADATAPTAPVQGDEWYDSENGVSYRRVFGLWVEIGA